MSSACASPASSPPAVSTATSSPTEISAGSRVRVRTGPYAGFEGNTTEKRQDLPGFWYVKLDTKPPKAKVGLPGDVKCFGPSQLKKLP